MAMDHDPDPIDPANYIWPTFQNHSYGTVPGSMANAPSPIIDPNAITLTFDLATWSDIARLLEELRHPVHGHWFRMRVLRGQTDKLIMEKVMPPSPPPTSSTSADGSVDYSSITKSIAGR